MHSVGTQQAQQNKASILQSIHQLLAADLALLHRLQSIQDALKSFAILVDGNVVHLDLAVGQEPLGDLPEGLCELEVLRLGGEIGGAELEVLAHGRVAQGRLVLDLLVDLVHGFGGDGEERAVDAAGGGDGRHGDVGARGFGHAVEGVSDAVVGVFFDVLGAGRGVVVEGFVGAETLDVGEVAGGAGRDDLEAGELGELDGEGAGGGGATVDEDGEFGGAGVGGERELEGLVEALSDAAWWVRGRGSEGWGEAYVVIPTPRVDACSKLRLSGILICASPLTVM